MRLASKTHIRTNNKTYNKKYKKTKLLSFDVIKTGVYLKTVLTYNTKKNSIYLYSGFETSPKYYLSKHKCEM